jgi:hypothetical protein
MRAFMKVANLLTSRINKKRNLLLVLAMVLLISAGIHTSTRAAVTLMYFREPGFICDSGMGNKSGLDNLGFCQSAISGAVMRVYPGSSQRAETR